MKPGGSGSRIVSLVQTGIDGLKNAYSGGSRPWIVLVGAIVVLAILIIPLVVFERVSRKEADSLRTKLMEVSSLGSEYQTLKGTIDAVEQRKSLTKVKGMPQAVEDVASSVGLAGKIKGVTAIGTREVKGGVTEDAEVRIEKVSMNELINILYRVEDAPVMLSVKKIAIKKTFENPELFNASLTLSLFLKQ